MLQSVRDPIKDDQEDCNDLIIEDDSEEFFCEICDFSSESSESLLLHLQEDHKSIASTSTETLASRSPPAIEYDENGENTTVRFMCSLCFNPFLSISAVKMHMMEDHKLKEKLKQTVDVPAVDNSEFLNLTLKDLITKLNMVKIHQCTIKGCMLKFESTERRDVHLKCHACYSNVRKFKCCECGEDQKNWRHCCLHLWKVHHIEHMYMLKCPICPFKAANTVKIYQHLQIHGGNKGFSCQVCAKIFPNYCQLRRHSLSHLEIQNASITRWYSQKTCQICLNVFANSKTLTKHMKRHNKIVSYRCNICGKGSTNKATWLIHMRQHTGEKPLKCKVCPFNARDPSVMRKHTLRHTAHKPYKCKHCNYSAIQTVGIKMHIRMNHPEEYEKMKCKLCKFISVSQELLERHYNDHKAGLVKSDEETKESEIRSAPLRMPDNMSSDCFLPLESTDAHDPPLDIGGVTIPAHSEDTQFTMFN